MVDPLRDDPFLRNGTKRELLVRFWYPTSITEGCDPAAYTSPAVWSYFSELAGFPLPDVRTNSCLDAPISMGPHPVVVFTHGYTGTFTDYTFLFEDLASRGYVVAAVDHTYEATAVEFLDGRLVKSVFGSHLAENTLRRDGQSFSLAVSMRSKDLQFVVDELERLNGEAAAVQRDYLIPAGKRAGLGMIGWHTLRHTYRSWMDNNGTPLGIQKDLMRHTDIKMTMNGYGSAMPEAMREANSAVVRMVIQ